MEEKLMSKNSLTVLAQKLAEKTGISQQDAELFIRKMFDVVNEGLQADKQVKMKWLGTFKVTSVKDRESVDVNTGERIVMIYAFKLYAYTVNQQFALFAYRLLSQADFKRYKFSGFFNDNRVQIRCFGSP